MHANTFSFVITIDAILKVPGTRQLLLTWLLRYRNWAYKPNSGWTKFYLNFVAILGGQRPKLWDLQPCLPPLPVPPLDQTIDYYLDSIRSLITKEEWEQTKKDCDEFQSTLGPVLQKMLLDRKKEMKTSSWLIDWWEKYVYLQQRSPIAIFCNWYGGDRIDPIIRSQSVRASNILSGMMRIKDMLDREKFAPNRVQGTVPLCMWQYSRTFGMVRVPGTEEDELVQYTQSRHIVVICNNQYFKLNMYYDEKSGKYLSRLDIQLQIERILDAAEKGKPDPYVAALTSQGRTEWAEHRQKLQDSNDVNRETLSCIESALFVCILDDRSPENDLDELSQLGMHRGGEQVWFDKNFNVTFFKNGRCIWNVDHTWSDASVLVHMCNFVFQWESGVASHWIPEHRRYESTNKQANFPKSTLPEPARLKWKIGAPVQKLISGAYDHLMQLTQAVDVHVFQFQYYGKALIKKLSMSPDAYVQLSLQLAYYKVHQHHTLTYESAGTVRFRMGRTETLRSATPEAAAWVECMQDPSVINGTKLAKLRLAIKTHSRNMRRATNGDGFDRHLLGLKILASGYCMQTGAPMPAIFTDKAYNLPFGLATSQTPAQTMTGGGFAPISQDGYGASYVVCEDRLWYHISAYNTSQVASVKKFTEALQESLLEMYDIFHSDENLSTVLVQREFSVLRA